MSIEIIGLIFAGVVATSTVCYVILTHQLAKETRALRKVQTEPRLSAVPRIHDAMFGIVHITIENVGLGLAKNLQFNLQINSNTPEASEILTDFTVMGFFESGLKYLVPGQVISSGYTNLLQQNHESALKASFVLIVNYEDYIGKKYKDEIILDMAELKGAYRLETEMQKLIKEIGKIAVYLKKQA